jgi:hypothetical protein
MSSVGDGARAAIIAATSSQARIPSVPEHVPGQSCGIAEGILFREQVARQSRPTRGAGEKS